MTQDEKMLVSVPDRAAALRVGKAILEAHGAWETENVMHGGQAPWCEQHCILLGQAAMLEALSAAPAQPAAVEGAGERGWDREICTGCASSMTISDIKTGGFVSCCPERRMVKISTLVEAFEASRRAHPSPPAASGDAILDEDRMPVWPTPPADDALRVAVEALEKIGNLRFQPDASCGKNSAVRIADEALAALKSEGK